MENPVQHHSCGHPIVSGTRMITPSCKECQKQYNDAFDACVKDDFVAEKLTRDDSAALDAAINFPMISGGLQATDDDNGDGEEEEPRQNGVAYNRKPAGPPLSGIKPPPFRPSKACQHEKPWRDRCASFVDSVQNICDAFIRKISDSIKPLGGLSLYTRQQQGSGRSSLLGDSDSEDSGYEVSYPLRNANNSMRNPVDVPPFT